MHMQMIQTDFHLNAASFVVIPGKREREREIDKEGDEKNTKTSFKKKITSFIPFIRSS